MEATEEGTDLKISLANPSETLPFRARDWRDHSIQEGKDNEIIQTDFLLFVTYISNLNFINH